MKRILILLSLLAVIIGAQAQGCLKGTVTDAKTGEPLPFVNVSVFQDGKQVHGGATDWDGIFTIKPLAAGKYDIEINAVGYHRYRREGVRVLPTGFTLLEISLNSTSDYNEVISAYEDSIYKEFYGHARREPSMIPLVEYEIVDSGLTLLLDRIVEGKENTYFWREEPMEPKPSPAGTTFNLYLFMTPSIDTTWDSVQGDYNYLYMLYRDDPSLPRSLEEQSPRFSFDSTTTCLSVVTTFFPQSFIDAEGFVRYHECVFFLGYPPVDGDDAYFRKTDRTESFLQKDLPFGAHRDPETWIYTNQQGHWYRWMELPNGW